MPIISMPIIDDLRYYVKVVQNNVMMDNGVDSYTQRYIPRSRFVESGWDYKQNS